MTARRVVLLALLLATVSLNAWGQAAPFTIAPKSLPVGGGMFAVGQPIPLQQLGSNPFLDASFNWAVSSGNFASWSQPGFGGGHHYGCAYSGRRFYLHDIRPGDWN